MNFEIHLFYNLYGFDCIKEGNCNSKKPEIFCYFEGPIFEDKELLNNPIEILKFLFKSKVDKYYFIISDYDNSIMREEIKNHLECFKRLCGWIIEMKIFKLIFVFSEKGISIIKI